MKITPYNWPSYARSIAAPADPEAYDEDAIARLVADMSPYIVDVKGVKYQFSARNRVKMIDFDNDDSRGRYNIAFEAYLAAMGKAESENKGGFFKLIEDLKFAQAAEIERVDYFAREMYKDVQEGYAAVCAAKFKATLAKTAYILMSRYKVPRKQISLIWGGDKIYSGKEKFLSSEEISSIIERQMNGEKIEKKVFLQIKKQLLASLSGIGNIPEEYKLDVQSAEERQDEIMRFQKGESLYCLYSFKSGGVGLSLHHTDEYTKEKCRRKPESNYAVEEDIPKIPTRPRKSLIAPTYSAIELVQGLGRCPRISSLSETLQELVFYKGTIEQSIAQIVSTRLKCLKQVVRMHEDWQDMILKDNTYKKPVEVVKEEWVEQDNDIVATDDDEDEDE